MVSERIEDLRARLYALILAAKRSEAVALLEAESSRSGLETAIAEILEPTLRLIGERWNIDAISLAQGYVGGKIAEDLLKLLVEQRGPGKVAKDRGRVVICNAEDDYHSLGRRMLGTFLSLDGWEVTDLGNDVLAVDLVDQAERDGARVVGVSAMMLTNARNIAKVRLEIDRRGLGPTLKLAVGGAVFVMRPELVAEVGGDGTAQTAVEAPGLFVRLFEEASR